MLGLAHRSAHLALGCSGAGLGSRVIGGDVVGWMVAGRSNSDASACSYGSRRCCFAQARACVSPPQGPPLDDLGASASRQSCFRIAAASERESAGDTSNSSSSGAGAHAVSGDALASTRKRKSPADIDAHSRAQPVRERPLYTHNNSLANVQRRFLVVRVRTRNAVGLAGCPHIRSLPLQMA
jgi:hypothetical protein